MNGDNKFGLKCAEFEALLADALDDCLGEIDEQRFQAHLATCSSCASMFDEAKAGLQWLSALKEEEVEPPAAMMEKILRATVGTSPIPLAAKPTKSWWARLKETPALAPLFHTVLQPRFAMGFGMAFFSISMLLNLAGVKVKNIRYIDLRPRAVVTAYYETTGKVVKYWENIRFVYEVESRVRDLKKATTPAQKNEQDNNKQQKEQKKDTNKETSGVPGQDGYQDRSEGGQLASATANQTETGSQKLDYGQRRLS